MFTILIIILILSTLGCSQQNEEINIDEFNISYLEKIDSKYLVGNNVSISVNVPNAKRSINYTRYWRKWNRRYYRRQKSGQNSYLNMKIMIILLRNMDGCKFNKEQRVSEKNNYCQDQSYESVWKYNNYA